MSAARVEAVVFDLGNVLAFHDNALMFRTLGARVGRSGEEVAALFVPQLWDRINRGQLEGEALRRELTDSLGVDLPGRELNDILTCHFSLNTEIFPLVESLVGRVKLLLLSNTMELHSRFVLPQIPVLERFDHLLLSHQLGLVKPQREIFEKALSLAGTAPEATAFFDDLPEYVAAAAALGIRAQLFQQTKAFPDQLRSLGL